MRQYYVYIPGASPHGPFAEAMVKSAYEQGMYPPGTKVWWEGCENWTPAESVWGGGEQRAVLPQPSDLRWNTIPVPPPLPPVPVMPPVSVTAPQKEEGESSPDSAAESAGQWGCSGIWGAMFALGIVIRWTMRYYKRNDFGDSIGWDILFVLLMIAAVVGFIVAICERCSKK
ncbi:MAG: GYF domain-containing protein [Bacteroidaceae bacterium]|nr:GYF domain-containing protein [Bacteroidaceae bacterium]